MTASKNVLTFTNERGRKVIDLTGHVYGKLTVISFAHMKGNHAFWLCRCECGAEKVIGAGVLRSGGTLSCGCKKRAILAARVEQQMTDREAKYGTRNLVGQRFGSLVIIEETTLDNGSQAWMCRCDCGKIVRRQLSTLTRGKWQNVSCGCRKGVTRRKDITGQRFGRLVALEIDEEQSRIVGRMCWRCRCDCGNESITTADMLTGGHTKSCGCLQREHTSHLGATVGIENCKAQSKYDWHVKVNGKRLALRSSFELIFAKYLLKHRIRFEYEPRRIQLAPDTIYIPDFYLPDTDTWVEVKGYASPNWLRKRAMFEHAGYKLLVVTQASIDSYLSGISYGVWMRRNSHKYLR